MKVQALAAYELGGNLKPFSYEVEQLQPHECLIKVLACGICHSDLYGIEHNVRESQPFVPGHEVVGEVVEVGSQVTHLKVGERVGVGWQRTSCLQCPDCFQGKENYCDRQQPLILSGYGAFADYLVSDSRFTFPIPAGIETHLAGPLLCAGVTVYSAMRSAGMTSGQEIGIIGIGGLGHLAVQFASRLGNSVTVFTTSDDKAEFASQLGARHVIVTRNGELPAPTRKLSFILNTAPPSMDCSGYLNYLDTDGTYVVVGLPSEPLTVPIWPLLVKRRRIMSSLTGGRASMVEMLSIAERFNIKPIVETFSFDQINEALQKVHDNKVRYRAVLTR